MNDRELISAGALPTYQSRRTHLANLFDPLVARIGGR